MLSCGVALAALLAAASAFAAAPEESAAPKPEDYAYAWPVRTSGSADFYEIELPLEVYRAVVDPALRDLGVFDARNRPVPRQLGAPPPPDAEPDEAMQLAALPVYAPAGVALSDLRLALEQESGGTRVRIESAAPASDSRQLALVAYLVDLGEASAGLRALDIAWPPEIEPFIATLKVEGSADLGNWTAIGGGTVAGLRQDGASIEQRRIAVNERPGRYLRLVWSGVPEGWRVSGLTAQFSRKAPEAAREWQTLQPAGTDPADGGFLYDLGGAPPIDRLALELPADNAWLRAGIHCRLAPETQWQRAHEGLFYRLHRDGNVLASDPAALHPRRCGQWKVVVERGSRDSRPALRLGWRVDRLLFIAEGEGPWTLAAGSARDAANDFPQERRYADADMRKLVKDALLAPATLGAREELGGELALQAPRSPEWRRWILWFGLVAGVLLVGGMAWKLARTE